MSASPPRGEPSALARWLKRQLRAWGPAVLIAGLLVLGALWFTQGRLHDVPFIYAP